MDTHILLVGVNHKTAPVALRERLAIGGQALQEALAHFSYSNGHPPALSEGYILSTCNRLEIYATSNDTQAGQEAVINFLSQNRGLPVEDFRDSVYLKTDTEAVTHLTRVACGLDSMIVGEPQILGQVNAAYQVALRQQATGPVLNRLLKNAIQAGKRARTETEINQYGVSVPSVAATLAEREVGNLDGKVVLVIGAGEMGELAARNLSLRGASTILVANRTYNRALALARDLKGEAILFEHMPIALTRADIVVTTTDAPQPIITPSKVKQAISQRILRPMVIIDIAVPRDTDPTVADLPGIHLFDIDDLESVVNGNIEARQREIPRVESIASEEVTAFMNWFCALDVVPTIKALRQRAETIKQIELEKALRRLGDLSEQEQQAVLALAHALVNKCLHGPTICLKEHAGQGDGHLYAGMVRELFDLEPTEYLCHDFNGKGSSKEL